MSKSTSMLPTLAGGSGVLAHALVDSDLVKVVDSVTLNADRDRKVTLAELKAFMLTATASDIAVLQANYALLDLRVDAEEASTAALETFVHSEEQTPIALTSGVPTPIFQIPLSAGTWEVSGIAMVSGGATAETLNIGMSGPSGVWQSNTIFPRVYVPASTNVTGTFPSSLVTVTGTGKYLEMYATPPIAGMAATGYLFARRIL